jgi:RNA polymerase sigma factor (sigma-70 family)
MVGGKAMSDAALRTDPESLLAHAGWVRELARRLAEGSDADDVEQATWLAALRSRPRGVALREWLGAVARNAARARRRAEGRRTEHEMRAARAEELPATVDLVARAELQRRLVGAVLALEEPYRSAVLLRWFEHLPPRAIAARLDLPVATVRTHLARGLARLRERLDAEHGGRRQAWIAALAPLGPGLDASPSGLGALLAVNAKIVVACATLTAVGAVAWWFSAAPRAARPGGIAAPAPSADERVLHEPAAGFELPARDDERVAAVPPPSEAPAVAAAASQVPAAVASARLSGRVLDGRGLGLAAVRVVARDVARDGGAESGEVEATSGADGAFAIEAAPANGTLESGSSAFVTVLEAPFGNGLRDDLHVVLAPRLALAGTVVDDAGTPVPAARVWLELPEDFRARFGVVLDHARTRGWSVRADADGRFALDDAPEIEGARLAVTADGFADRREPAPVHSDLNLRIVLARPHAAESSVRGVVLDSAGAPFAGALVALGLDTQRTDADGGFAFDADPQSPSHRMFGGTPTRVTAAAAGWMPALYEAPLEDGRPLWPEQVRLRLEVPPLSISGRVVDAEGEPLERVSVYVADATLFGTVDGRPALLETLFSGSGSLWSFVHSDADGRFAIDGLLDRDYVVRAHHGETLLRVDSEPTPAGTRGLELRLPTDRLHPLVAGRVLSLGGAPVAGASVHPMCDALRVRHAGRTLSTSHDARAAVVTDADGRFELRDVPMSLVYLRVDGEDILPVEYGRYVEDDPRFAGAQVRELPLERITALEIRVETRRHMQVQLARAELADELAVLAADGRELSLSLFSAGGRRDGPRHPIHGGRSAMLSVPESGATLVLYLGGVEVDRSPLRLEPGGTTLVQR